MTKPFLEALQDGYKKISKVNDPEVLKKLRDEGVLVDTEGFYSFEFGDNHEFNLQIEPIGEGYLISLYKNKIRITEPLPVKPL